MSPRRPASGACFPAFSSDWRAPFIAYDDRHFCWFGFSHWIEGVPPEFRDVALFLTDHCCKRMTTPYTRDKIERMHAVFVAALRSNGVPLESVKASVFELF